MANIFIYRHLCEFFSLEVTFTDGQDWLLLSSAHQSCPSPEFDWFPCLGDIDQCRLAELAVIWAYTMLFMVYTHTLS